MLRLPYILSTIFLAITFASCNTNEVADNKIITVSIEPLKGIVEDIVGDDFQVNTLLPAGTSPESYSPGIQQIADLEKSEQIYIVGTLPFENEVIRHTNYGLNKVVNLSQGINLLHSSECNNNAHHHAIDPHIWVSLDELATMVENIEAALMESYPDSIKYSINSQRVITNIKCQKESYEQLLITAPKSILIYHPSLGYIANTFSFKQIPLENEGKTPTPSYLTKIVDIVKKEGLEVMIYQKEYPLSIIQPIADVLGVNTVEFNPLSSDILGEIDRVINIITGNYEQ